MKIEFEIDEDAILAEAKKAVAEKVNQRINELTTDYFETWRRRDRVTAVFRDQLDAEVAKTVEQMAAKEDVIEREVLAAMRRKIERRVAKLAKTET